MGAYIFDETSGTVLVPCRWCGKRETFRVNLENFRKWTDQHELIQNAMPELSVDKREMLVSNTCSTCWNKYIVIDEDEPEERCIYYPSILDPNVSMEEEVSNDQYILAMQNYKIGDKVRLFVSAPGIGHYDYQITRMDETGIWGIVVESTARELTPEEVR